MGSGGGHAPIRSKGEKARNRSISRWTRAAPGPSSGTAREFGPNRAGCGTDRRGHPAKCLGWWSDAVLAEDGPRLGRRRKEDKRSNEPRWKRRVSCGQRLGQKLPAPLAVKCATDPGEAIVGTAKSILCARWRSVPRRARSGCGGETEQLTGRSVVLVTNRVDGGRQNHSWTTGGDETFYQDRGTLGQRVPHAKCEAIGKLGVWFVARCAPTCLRVQIERKATIIGDAVGNRRARAQQS